ncbi:amino acid adenylation domain-containing protein [Streptomyces sp. NPDC053474]|uniref:amino acid adenylation domain-containing protein n=1 Tax=Streptomyces sp. NPDC053474 TaxID=3365704 RepID=UPI0037CD9BCF
MTTHRPAVRLTLPPDLMARVAALARKDGCQADTVVAAAVAATLFRYDRVEERRLITGGTPSAVRVTDAVRFTDLVAQAHSASPAPTASAAPSTPSAPDAVQVVLHTPPGAEEATAEITAPEGQWTPAALESLLRHALAEPATRVGSLRLLSAEQAAARIAATDAGAAAAPAPHPLHRPFEEQAARHPDRVALLTGDDTVTYGELDARAERFADRLTALGAGPERPVALHLRRSTELVVALLAVLKCGAPFVPLDDRMPPERIRTVLSSARAQLLVSAPGTRAVDGLDVPCVTERPDTDTTDTAERAVARASVHPHNAAFIYFTSGSTGVPKGVVTDHTCAAIRVDWTAQYYGLGPGTVTLHKTPLIFDVAVIEILAPLSAGGAVRLAEPHGEGDVAHLVDLLTRGEVTFVHFVPSMLKVFLDEAGDAKFPGVRWVQTSGEALPTRLLDGVRQRFGDAEIHSAYGQSETCELAVWAGRRPHLDTGVPPHAAHVPVGRQVGLYRPYVLDEALQPVPDGVPGEICVAGVGGLARGYHHQPALTAERFVPHPYALAPGERLYRTGDLGAHAPDGQILFLGRADTQTKIRGARVEPAEVEAVLAEGPGVRDCAVLVRPDEQGDATLVGYVVGTDVDIEELARWAAKRLTSHLLPQVYVRMPALPSTASGKLDRTALPAPTAKDRAARGEGEQPRSHLEAELCRLWSRVLTLPDVGPTDNFFSLGGNSLKVAQVMVRISALFGIRVPVAAFFEDPTVRGLAALIERTLGELVGSMSEQEAAERIEALNARGSGG